MKNDEILEHDDFDFMSEDTEENFESLEDILARLGKTEKQAEKEYSSFMLWLDAVKTRFEIMSPWKALFCRSVCEALEKEYNGDLAKMWCLCMSEHSDFLFEERLGDDENDLKEYRLYQYLLLSEDMENYMRRLKKEPENREKFLRLCGNITFSDTVYTEIDAERFYKIISDAADLRGEFLEDNIRFACEKISHSKELSEIIPNVFYVLFMRYGKKLRSTEGYEPNFKAALRYISYGIEKDNGKNQETYTEHIDMYEALCSYFKSCNKELCDAGFVCMSNLCLDDNLPWEDFPDFSRPLENELETQYFSCFPDGLNDNPVFAANDIDVDDIAAYEDYYDTKLPPKLRITDKARKYIGENEYISERYLELLQNDETDKCMRLIYEIIEKSDIDPSFIKPDMADLVNAVIMEKILENISLRTKKRLIELIPLLRENIKGEISNE